MKKVSLDTIKCKSLDDLLGNPFVYHYVFEQMFDINGYVRNYDDEVLGFIGSMPTHVLVDDITLTFSPFCTGCSFDNHQELHLLAKKALRAIAEALTRWFSPDVRLEIPDELMLDDISCYQHDCGKILKMEIDYEENHVEFSLYER